MYDFKKVEEDVKKLWKDLDLLKRIEAKNKNGKKFFMLDGPPYANYVPHVGHMKTTVAKDFYIRFAMMQGHNVLFQPGFDTHGLPIENMVEKNLKLKSKQDIEKLGIKKFVQECRNSAATNKDLWLKYYSQVGAWYAWKTPYLTYENYYLESAWWAFKQQWDKGMIYEGKKPVHWCPHCQTSLAGYEVTDSYKIVTDPSVYVMFKLKDIDASLLVFTTTPWTLPSNVIIAVADKEDYVEVETNKGNVILAKERLELLEKFEIKYKIKKTFKGKELIGKEYESLIDVPVQKELQKNPKALKIYASIPILKERVASKVGSKKGLKQKDVFSDFVNVEEGTGLVHCAPGHGKADNEVGIKYNLPDPSPLDDECKFTDEAGMWADEFVKDADHGIADHLHKTKKLLKYEKIRHSYPLCWRCKSPLIFRLSNQWFIKIGSIKEKILSSNEKINWQPEFAKERFQKWVANADDWNFSRQRYWGIPIPIWKCEDCGELKVISSHKDLQKHAKVKDDFDLHAVSDIKLDCKCGEKMERVPHIFDVWYDSGCAPFASLGYPNANKKLLDEHYPVSRVSESQDQIRGWFYSMMFVGTSVFGKAPYQAVSMPGWVLDDKGEKMSKSLGNMVYAMDALEKFGSDVVRFYYFWETAMYNTTKFNMNTIKTEISKLFNIYWNLHQYVLTQSMGALPPKPKEIEDKWIISRLNTTVSSSLKNFEDFEWQNAGRAIYSFIVDDLSRTYVQIVRDRIEDDEVPVNIMNHCIIEITKVMSPMSPFVTDKVYQEMKNINEGLKESVHLENLPKPGKSDSKLEESMNIVLEIIASGLACRDKSQLGVRWPVQELIVDTSKKEVVEAIKKLSKLIEIQCNVKKVYVKQMNAEVQVKPDFKALGVEFGTETGDVANLIKKEAESIAKNIASGKAEIKIGKYKVKKDQLVVEKKPVNGFEASEFKLGTVYLNKSLTKELEAEGFAREVTRRVQQLRKEAGLDKRENIDLCIETKDLIQEIELHKEAIKKKVGAIKIFISDKVTAKHKHSKEEKVKGKSFKIMFNIVK